MPQDRRPTTTGADVLVVGDANPDLVLTGDVVPRFGQAEQVLDQASLVLGGSGAITAHALARLGRSVAMAAAVGDDALGVDVRRRLEAAGVDTEHVVVRSQVATGLTVVLSRRDDRAMLTYPGAVDTLDVAQVLGALPGLCAAGLRHLHLASYFLMPSAGADLVGLLAAAREAGVTTSLDTNDDPSRRWRGVESLLPHLDLLLPNRSEVLGLGGGEDPRAAARDLARRGPTVVVKDGADGAFAVRDGEDDVSCPAMPAVPVDTTGAGDTFDAAFLDAWLDGAALPEALRRATVAATLSLAAVGGTAGQPTRAEIDAALAAGTFEQEASHES